MKIEKVKDCTQERWPLIPSLIGKEYYPSISQYNENPAKWSHLVIPHAIYAITFQAHEIRTGWTGHTFIRSDYFGKELGLKVETAVDLYMQALASGNLRYNGSEVILVGTFVKSGKTVYFKPYTEQL
ncbi:hypothetical protein MYO4S_00121 [Serratia phage 4S]|nr:hypothetical protein MYO4S_00121 [Serratia phage 4S]